MKKINCQDSLWFRAMSLKERIAVSSDELVDDVELGERTATVGGKGREAFANKFYEVIVKLIGADLC